MNEPKAKADSAGIKIHLPWLFVLSAVGSAVGYHETRIREVEAKVSTLPIAELEADIAANAVGIKTAFGETAECRAALKQTIFDAMLREKDAEIALERIKAKIFEEINFLKSDIKHSERISTDAWQKCAAALEHRKGRGKK